MTSSMVCSARKTLPCQQNHGMGAAGVGAGSDRGGGDLGVRCTCGVAARAARPALAVRGDQEFGFVQSEVPRPGIDQCAARVWWVRLDAAGTDEDVDAFGVECFDAAAEWGAAGERGVDERHYDDGDAKADCLGEDAQGVGVTDAVGPFVDGVVGGGRDDDRVGFLGPGFAWFAVLAADGRPVWDSMAAGSKKSRAAGVAMIWTVQLLSWACLIRMLMALAGPARHTMTDRTRCSPWVTG
jgi:hypothetical protein